MFTRRLKIILTILALVTAALMARAAQIQIVDKREWSEKAADLMLLHQFVETTRGKIVDCHGRTLAEDEPCIDACVYYPALTEDVELRDKWLTEQAAASATLRYGDAFTKAKAAVRKQMVEAQVDYLRSELPSMWALLAQVSDKSPAEIETIRRTIIQRVEMRQQYVWWQNYQKALDKHKQTAVPKTWYNKLWHGESDEDASNFDNFSVDVAEQSLPHVILPAIDNDTYNTLAKNAERFPGIALRTSHHRVYPLGQVACHAIGQMTSVGAEQIKNDPNNNDPLRKYWPNDLIGQAGIESLCEGVLRGSRGEITQTAGDPTPTATTDPVPGADVHLTLDAELEQDIADSFAMRREFRTSDNQVDEVRQDQHGAAVIIDIPTGQVRAMVSYPGFDPNTLATEYPKLSRDDLNEPLLNRATQAAVEPGSTAKTMMALGALNDGTIDTSSTIECTGYLVLNGVRHPNGKCWTMREYGYLGALASHHQLPSLDPHPTGFLTVTDAIERSCNVFFETLADRMGMARQRYWYSQFGLGRPTGIGLPEVAGRIPNPDRVPPALLREKTWFCGIGQSDVAATPLQMCNAVATIARDGILIRPRIVDDSVLSPATGRPAFLDQPDRVDLKLSPESLAAVRLGMTYVINRFGGTGSGIITKNPTGPLDEILLAAKTGTPQAPHLTVPMRDEHEQIIVEDGHQKRQIVPLGMPGTETWYIGDGPEKQNLSHAWIIGFAPAGHPQIAFCVFVEYGARGGQIAGGIAREALMACIKRGYLKPDPEGDLPLRDAVRQGVVARSEVPSHWEQDPPVDEPTAPGATEPEISPAPTPPDPQPDRNSPMAEPAPGDAPPSGDSGGDLIHSAQ